MPTESLYARLADHFDHFIVGAPCTETLLAILRILFPPAEAEIALHMPVMHKMNLAEIQAAVSPKASRLRVRLERRPHAAPCRYSAVPVRR